MLRPLSRSSCPLSCHSDVLFKIAIFLTPDRGSDTLINDVAAVVVKRSPGEGNMISGLNFTGINFCEACRSVFVEY